MDSPNCLSPTIKLVHPKVQKVLLKHLGRVSPCLKIRDATQPLYGSLNELAKLNSAY